MIMKIPRTVALILISFLLLSLGAVPVVIAEEKSTSQEEMDPEARKAFDEAMEKAFLARRTLVISRSSIEDCLRMKAIV